MGPQSERIMADDAGGLRFLFEEGVSLARRPGDVVERSSGGPMGMVGWVSLLPCVTQGRERRHGWMAGPLGVRIRGRSKAMHYVSRSVRVMQWRRGVWV